MSEENNQTIPEIPHMVNLEKDAKKDESESDPNFVNKINKINTIRLEKWKLRKVHKEAKVKMDYDMIRSIDSENQFKAYKHTKSIEVIKLGLKLAAVILGSIISPALGVTLLRSTLGI